MDYKVGIGTVWCDNLKVTDSEVSCAPPDEHPDINPQREKRDAEIEAGQVVKRRSKRETRIAKVGGTLVAAYLW